MAMNLLLYANYRLDVLMLEGSGVESVSIGLYAVAVGLAGLLWVVPDAFKEALYNIVARRNAVDEIVMAIAVNMLLALFVATGFFFLGRWFLSAMYGPDFADAHILVLILFVGTFPMILYKLIHPLYMAKGRSRTLVLTLGLSAAINVVLNLLLIPRIGSVGAASASVISYSITGAIFAGLFVKEYEVRPVRVFRKSISYLRSPR